MSHAFTTTRYRMRLQLNAEVDSGILYATKRTSIAFCFSVALWTSSKMDVKNFIKVATLCAAVNEGLLDAPGHSRAYSVHPFNRGRNPFPRFFENIRKSPDNFLKYYRM